LRLSDIEPRGSSAGLAATVALPMRPDFNWNRQTVNMMGYR
jgi:hypothetical protein